MRNCMCESRVKRGAVVNIPRKSHWRRKQGFWHGQNLKFAGGNVKCALRCCEEVELPIPLYTPSSTCALPTQQSPVLDGNSLPKASNEGTSTTLDSALYQGAEKKKVDRSKLKLITCALVMADLLCSCASLTAAQAMDRCWVRERETWSARRERERDRESRQTDTRPPKKRTV